MPSVRRSVRTVPLVVLGMLVALTVAGCLSPGSGGPSVRSGTPTEVSPPAGVEHVVSAGPFEVRSHRATGAPGEVVPLALEVRAGQAQLGRLFLGPWLRWPDGAAWKDLNHTEQRFVAEMLLGPSTAQHAQPPDATYRATVRWERPDNDDVFLHWGIAHAPLPDAVLRRDAGLEVVVRNATGGIGEEGLTVGVLDDALVAHYAVSSAECKAGAAWGGDPVWREGSPPRLILFVLVRATDACDGAQRPSPVLEAIVRDAPPGEVLVQVHRHAMVPGHAGPGRADPGGWQVEEQQVVVRPSR
jgi:hypothetical protein